MPWPVRAGARARRRTARAPACRGGRHLSLPLARLARRDPEEPHRTSTVLELFLDLATVIAIAAAAAGLHHDASAGHVAQGALSFALAFFAVWWAWMNYTWFASAYADDGLAFRLAAFAFIAGALILAAGIPAFFATHARGLIVGGYVVMRAAMIWLWLSAARGDPGRAPAAHRYAAGIALVQVWWLGLLVLPFGWGAMLVAWWVAGGLIEMAVPLVAERGAPTPWHRHHIIERYGLLTIIVLGETLLSASAAIRAAAEEGRFDPHLAYLGLAALVIALAVWWLYFTDDEHLERRALSFVWGYGHVAIFAGVAMAGAAVGVLTDTAGHHAQVAAGVGNTLLAVALALVLVGLWFVRDRFQLSGWRRVLLPGAAVAVLASAALPAAAALMAVVMVATAGLRGRRA